MTRIKMANVIDQIKNEIEVDAAGRGRASIRATARLAGVDDESIRKSLVFSADLKPSKLTELLILHGFEGADLENWRSSGIPDIAVAIILEYYALDAGRYIKEQAKLAYKAFATIGIRTWMQKIKGWEQREQQAPQSQPQSVISSLEEISTLLDLAFGKTGLDVKLVALAKLEAMGKKHPHLLSVVKQAKSILVAPIEENLLAPKQLAEILKVRNGGVWTPQKVNNFLTAQGFQVSNEEGQPDYLPTSKGKVYSKLILSTAKGETVQHLRWSETVLEVLQTSP